MIDRVDLLIAVIGVVVSALWSSTAMWMALSKKPDREDLARVATKLDTLMSRKPDRQGLARVETKLDTLIMRFVPGPRTTPRQQ